MIILTSDMENVRETLSGIQRITVRHTHLGRTLITAYDRDDKASGEIDVNEVRVELLPEALDS